MKILDKYEILFENTLIPVVIYSNDGLINIYDIGILEIGEYSRYVVEKIKEDLLREGIFENQQKEYTYEELKKSYSKKVSELISYYLPMLHIEDKEKVLTYIIQKSLDLGFVDILIADTHIEEVTVNGPKNNVMIYHAKHGWLETNLQFFNDDEIKNIAARIALENKKFFSNLNPLLDAHLRGGHRVNATLDSISTKGSSITIRRFSDTPWTVTDMINSGTSSSLVLSLIWIAIENEFSLIVSGGTGSGKTSFLNSIATFIDASQRIVSVEDTREIRLPKYAHWVPMEARQPNQEGKGGISMLDLIINSLRMRPDRIVIGEIRKKEEAEVLFEAMRTGHSVYGTFHATNANETLTRLSSSPIQIPRITLSALGLIVVQHRDRKSGKRVTLQIAEVDENGNETIIIQYNPKTKKHEFKNKPAKLIKYLNEFQGIEEEEFFSELKKRAFVLHHLAKLNINDITEVGKTINNYYINSDELIERMKSLMKQQHEKV